MNESNEAGLSASVEHSVRVEVRQTQRGFSYDTAVSLRWRGGTPISIADGSLVSDQLNELAKQALGAAERQMALMFLGRQTKGVLDE